jgi:AcrR family transcriptional regulator
VNSAVKREVNTPAYRREPEAKKQQLLIAARGLFAEVGFDAASTAQIAQRAGVSEGILFHHFGSKRGLFAQLAEAYGREATQATMPEALADLTAEAILRGAFAFADREPALFRLFVEDEVTLEKLGIKRARDVLVGSIRSGLEKSMAEGAISVGDAEIIANLEFDLVISLYRAWRRTGDPDRKEDFITEGIRCLGAIENNMSA